jgi:cytochrome c-type biogenesis protein CcmH/NrfG
MTQAAEERRRLDPATLALIGAALLAAVAIAIAIWRSDSQAMPDAEKGNMAAPASAAGAEEMVAGLRERLRQEPGNHEGWFLLGMALRDSGRFTERTMPTTPLMSVKCCS